MNRAVTVAVLLSPLLGFLPPGANQVFPQESAPALDKILDPFPDLDPFEKAFRTPEYFPDDVDKRVRDALIDSLTGRAEALKSHAAFFSDKDAKLTKEHGAITGLTEHALDLSNNTIPDRERYLAAQKKALDAASSPQQKYLIESRLRGDELTRADELLRKSSTNRWGGRLNRLLGSVDLVGILSGSYIGAAVDSTISQLVGAGSTQMSVEERKALTLYEEHLARYPEDPENDRVREQVEALEKKKKQILVEKRIENAQQAMDKTEWEHAAYHYEIAALIDPSSKEATENLEQVKKLLREENEEGQKGLAVAAQSKGTASARPDTEDREELLYALAARDAARIETEAKASAEKHRGDPLGTSAKDAFAVALEIKGKHAEAKKVLENIVRSSAAPSQKKRAKTLLESPEYNLLASFEHARAQRRLQTFKYVLLGEDMLRKNLLHATAPLVAGGPAGATSVAAANVIMIGSNLYEVLTANPVSNQMVLDRGVDYIRNHPQSEDATGVYHVLAEGYEEIGRYDKAIAYYQMAGKVEDKKIAELKGKAAAAFLQAADRSGDKSTRELYLKAILDHYPETAAAKEATSKLAALTKIENQGLRISKKFLTENPELYGPQGLRLKGSLFDGNIHNTELAKQGVSLLSNEEIVLHFDSPWGVQSRIYPIEKETGERFQIALRKKNYEVAVADVNLRPKGSPGGIRDIPLPILKGEAGMKESDEPGETTISLVRHATEPAPDFPKVLDSQLLSDKEKPGAKPLLPPIQGSISGRGLNMSGSLPTGLWGDRFAFGTDERSPFAGVQLPIPLLQDFIPVDFMLQGRPGQFSLFPKIHIYEAKGDDRELYR